MPMSRQWDVTVKGRIEDVTDQDAFPEAFLIALSQADGISVVTFNRPTWPHTTSAVIRLGARNGQEAERAAREVMVQALQRVARAMIGDRPFGWSISVDVQPAASPSLGLAARSWMRDLRGRVFRR